jgi:hypothetical protein
MAGMMIKKVIVMLVVGCTSCTVLEMGADEMRMNADG